MKVRILIVGAFALTLAASNALAQSWSWNSAGSSTRHWQSQAAKPDTKIKTSVYSASLKLNEVGVTNTSACTTSSYAAACASGNCSCIQFTGTSTGSAGKADAALNITIDNVIGVDGIGVDFCGFAHGDLEIDGNKDTEIFAVTGAACNDIFGDGYFNGGCDLEATDVYFGGAGGPCVGAFTSATGFAASIKAFAQN